MLESELNGFIEFPLVPRCNLKRPTSNVQPPTSLPSEFIIKKECCSDQERNNEDYRKQSIKFHFSFQLSNFIRIKTILLNDSFIQCGQIFYSVSISRHIVGHVLFLKS